MMKKKILSIVMVGIMAFSTAMVLPAASVSAACSNKNPLPGFRSWSAGLNCEGSGEKEAIIWKAGKSEDAVANEMNKIIWTIVLNLTACVTALVGYICIVMIIVAGYKIMSAGGSADKIASGKKTLMRAVIGLIICILARSITQIFLNIVTGVGP